MITNFNFAVMQLQEAPYSCGARIELGGGGTAAAMGILSRGFRAKLFLSLWSSFGS
jgi:hypothetical protein